MARTALFLFILLIPLSLSAFAADIYVPDDYPAIQAAIDAAAAGDTVIVRPGTYVENISFNGKAVTVRSEQGFGSTVIEGASGGEVVSFRSGEGPDSVLEGFTITNGLNGIMVYQASPTILNNIVTGNGGGWSGGGIELHFSTTTIANNVIAGNSAQVGAGIYCEDSTLTIVNDTIVGNTADWGAGIAAGYTSSVIVKNTIIWGNQAPVAPAILVGDVYYHSDVFIDFSDVEGGRSAAYAKPGNTLNWGKSMIDEDPLFADPGNGDWHILWTSPCVNRGTNDGSPALDFEGDARPWMGNADMGADEVTDMLPLEADSFALSAASGGTVHFFLFGGAPNGGRTYVLLGSLSGTAPGMKLPGGMVLPVNFDSFSSTTYKYANTPPFQGFQGRLSFGSSTAQAALDTMGPVPGLIGKKASFAYALTGPIDFVSNAVIVEILP